MTTNNERVADTSKTIDHISQEGKKVSLTEQWKKGELPEDVYYVTYYKNDTPEVDIYRRVYSLYNDSKVRFTIQQVDKVLAPVPSYEDWQSLNGLIDSMQDTNKALAHRLNMLKDMLLKCREAIEEAQKNYGYDDSIVEILEPVTTKIDEVLK